MNRRYHWGRLAARLACLALLALAGCRARVQDRTPDGRVIVRYWEKWTGFEGEAMQRVVDDFNASQTEVRVEMLPVGTIDQKLMLSITGGNPPDLAGLWSHSVPVFAEKNALTPLDKQLADAGLDSSRYIPAVWGMCRHRGFTWALPTTPATLALWYNKRLFREAGLDPDRPPRTLAELDAMADRLTIVEVVRDGKPVRLRFPELTDAERAAHGFTIVQLGHSPGEPGWWRQMWPYWFGGSLTDGPDKLTVDTPANERALDWYAGYARRFGVDNLQSFSASFGNFASAQNPFLAGTVAMELQGVWMYNYIEKYAPDMEWGVAPFPAETWVEGAPVTVAESDVIVIPRGARHPREAFAFLRFLQSRPELEKLCAGQRKFSPLADTSPEFIAGHPNPSIQVFIDLAKSPRAVVEPRLTMWYEIKDELLVATGEVFALRQTPAEALAGVQARCQPKLERIVRRWRKVQPQREAEWQAHETW